MRSRIRLGPAAIFLLVVAIIVVTLSMLTISTSNADLVMAGRFADVTRTRYSLKADGELFLCEAEEAADAGRDLKEISGVRADGDGYLFEKEAEGYKLEVRISRPDESGRCEIRQFSISRIWQPEDPAENVWKGNGLN